jgi:hypothetical protein
MMSKELKRYRCEKGHVVGLIRWDGHGASRLLYLRESIDETSAAPAEPVVAAIIDSGDVTCSICGLSLVWVPSVPAMLRLLKSHRKLMDGLREMDTMANPGFLGT